MENNEKPKTNTTANRRKNEWKYAAKRKRIYDLNFCSPSDKPLHYYSKNTTCNGYKLYLNNTNNKGSRRYISKNYAPQKNWDAHDKRQIDNYENQLEELFDFN